MNFEKLFQTQQILRDRINYNKSDRFDKLILSAYVELAECAQQYRKFKFWSQDQEPRKEKVKGMCVYCAGTGNQSFDIIDEDGEAEHEDCHACNGSGEEIGDPLLEEFADGLHFILELGIEIDFQNYHLIQKTTSEDNGIDIFNEVFETIAEFQRTKNHIHYRILIETYLLLGEKLGYTPREIEKAYYDKNQVNHVRQDTGY